MAASMDVNLQMDQYHAHHSHVNSNSLNSHSSSGHLQLENNNPKITNQFGMTSQSHYSHIHEQQNHSYSLHNPSNLYSNSTPSVQQIMMQHQRSGHFNAPGFENAGDHHMKLRNADNSQVHMQMPLHQQHPHSLQTSHNSANTHLSPSIDQHSPSTLSKDVYTSGFHQMGEAAMPHGSLMQQSMYPYPNDASQTQHPTSIAAVQSATNNQLMRSHMSMQMNNNAMDLSDPHTSAHPNDASRPFQQPVSYIPPTKKRRGRPPTHTAVDHGPTGLVDEDEHTLYGAIRSGRVAPQIVVDDWIEQYKTNREPAMLELIQFFVSCSGCKGKVTPEMYSQLSHAEIIRRMTEEFEEDSGEYPLIQTSPTWKRFRSNFIEFIQVLVRQCQYSIIYDQCMIDQVISLLTGLTDSQVRAFRHTSTLAAMKMMTALVDVALNVSINRDNTQRQYEAERSKMQNRRASERLEVLMHRRQELEENMDEVKNMLIYIFKGVFVHRYRDNQAEIRAICMQEIGIWMRRYPAMFLDDSYLKYVGWTLYDRNGDVRVQCLRALQPLYEDPTLINGLELFTSRFKSRLVDMTLDKETDVAVQAVKLVSCILKHNDSILEDKDCENIYELVYCTHRPLAQAAGEFLTLKLFEIDAHAPATKTKKGKRRSENTPLIRDLVQFFIESELHEHATYLVDSLWDLCPMLRDWEAMLDLLLEEPGRGEEPLDANQEMSLIEIMVCCVCQAATGESPVGRQGGHHSHTSSNLLAGGIGLDNVSGRNRGGVGAAGGGPPAREARALAEERARMTEAMITALPALLAKYGESPERAANLLTIPRYMEMELYTTGRHERHLDLLLQVVQDIVERHTDPSTLLACSRVYEALCVDELSIAAKCQTVRGTLLDHLIDLYRNAFLNYFNEQGDDPDQDDEFHLLSALKRIYAFYACGTCNSIMEYVLSRGGNNITQMVKNDHCHDLSGLDLWESLLRITKSGNEINPEIVVQAISCCSKSLLWNLSKLNENDADKNEIETLRRDLHEFMQVCIGYLDHQSKILTSESYMAICDHLVVFSRHLVMHLPHLKSVVYPADRELESKLTDYLERRVFVDVEDDEDENSKFEFLHECRTQLAAFFKLVVYNLIPIKAAAPLYKYYIKSFNDFGDIMKYTLSKTREINRVHTARMIALCLQLCYTQVENASPNNRVERGYEGLQAVKELARRLNLSFGLDLLKIREAMVAFHSEGIQFCVARAAATSVATGQPPGVPENLIFLEIVAEFSNKLLRQDKKGLSEYVRRVFPNPIGEEWTSLHAYRSSLDPDAVDLYTGSSKLDANTAGYPSAPLNPLTTAGGAGTSLSNVVNPNKTTGTAVSRSRNKKHAKDSDLSLTESPIVPQSTSTVVRRKRTANVLPTTKSFPDPSTSNKNDMSNDVSNLHVSPMSSGNQ